MLATSDGLYVGSDTELIGHTPGNTYHARIAFLPLDRRPALPQLQADTLPVDVYRGGDRRLAAGEAQLHRHHRHQPRSTRPPDPGWSTSTGAFMVNGVLYKVNTDGSLSKMTFDGTTYGTATPVNTADALAYQTDWHTDARTLTSIFYSGGYIYYTKSGPRPRTRSTAAPSRSRTAWSASSGSPRRPHRHQLRQRAGRVRRRAASSTTSTPPASSARQTWNQAGHAP